MRILGIDPALNFTGYGLIEAKQNKLTLIEAGIVRTRSTQKIQDRLNKIYQSIFKLVEDTKPSVLAIEKIYAHWQYPTTAYALGHARGVVCLVCARFNIPLAEYGATKIKKAVVGNGMAKKEQVQRMVQQVLGLKEIPAPDDVSDALAVAIAHHFISTSRDRIYGSL